MAEIFATAAAAAGALEQCIKLFARINKAIERQKDLKEQIAKYSDEVSQTKNTVEVIEDEEELKTPNVGVAIIKLKGVAEALQAHLTKIAITKGPVQDFIKQLFVGDKIEEKLDSIMRDLGNAKLDLILPMLLSNVGLTRGVGKAVQINTATVEAMNKLLNEKLGSGHSLRISKLLEGRPRNADATVTLTQDDIDALSKEASQADLTGAGAAREGKVQSSRTIKDNEAASYALQVNTPVGVDVWKDVGIVTIEGNRATENAIQWNYPIASVDAFLAALQARKP